MHRAQDAAILGLLLEGARRALVGDQAHTQRYLGYVITSHAGPRLPRTTRSQKCGAARRSWSARRRLRCDHLPACLRALRSAVRHPDPTWRGGDRAGQAVLGMRRAAGATGRGQ
jgi:hypothetical protein